LKFSRSYLLLKACRLLVKKKKKKEEEGREFGRIRMRGGVSE